MSSYDPLAYLEAVARRLEESGGLPISALSVYAGEAGDTATLDGALQFPDGSRLEVTITVSATADYPA
jgi:hypothetical protein